MYKLDLPVDMKESAAIERRRNRELQRQSRIFNARVRTIGIDLMRLTSKCKIVHDAKLKRRGDITRLLLT